MTAPSLLARSFTFEPTAGDRHLPPTPQQIAELRSALTLRKEVR